MCAIDILKLLGIFSRPHRQIEISTSSFISNIQTTFKIFRSRHELNCLCQTGFNMSPASTHKVIVMSEKKKTELAQVELVTLKKLKDVH